MKTLIGGAIAAVVGLILWVVYFKAFLQILAGIIPVVLLLAGCLALYLGFDELKDSWKNEGESAVPDDKDREIERLKKEIDEIKK